MKKATAIILGMFAMIFSASAASETSLDYYGNIYNGNSYIFEEGGVEFSVFPDGQFDFVYLGPNRGNNVNVNLNTPGVSLNFNSGYNYDAFVQYDDYGAVIQIENVPIYYDEFGRIVQAGSVEIRYTNRRIVRVGGLFIHYGRRGYFSHCTGFISPWYRTYVYRPWHGFYVRPFFNNCIVYDYPYRRFYNPVRYSYVYHRSHYNRGFRNYSNARRSFHRPGSRVHYRNGRTAVNRDFNPNRRNTAVSTRNGNTGRRDVTNARNSRDISRERTINNSRPKVTSNRGDKNVKSRPVTTTRPKYSTSRNTNRVTKGRPVVKNNSNSKVNRSNRKSISNSRTKPNRKVTSRGTNYSRPKTTKRSNEIKRSTSVKRNKSTVSRKSTSSGKSSNRGSSRRGRL